MSDNLQDTNKLSKVTEEMLETFSDKKAEQESEESSVLEPNEENKDKTVVEFEEDDVVEEEKPKKKKKHGLFLKSILIIILLTFVGIAIFGIGNRWFRYDDEQQLISNGQINGTSAVVAIDGKTINLNPNAILEYSVDTTAKVIYYKTGDKSGESHYRFSGDRNQLAFVESTAYDPISTMISDIAWFGDWATCGMSKIDLSPAYTKNNKEEVDTENTGLDDIMNNGKTESILLDRIPTKKAGTTL